MKVLSIQKDINFFIRTPLYRKKCFLLLKNVLALHGCPDNPKCPPAALKLVLTKIQAQEPRHTHMQRQNKDTAYGNEHRLSSEVSTSCAHMHEHTAARTHTH